MRRPVFSHRFTPTLLAGLCAFAGVRAERTPVAAPDAIPAEFRALWQEQQAMVEVMLYGRTLGVFAVNITPETIRLLQPETALTHIQPPTGARERLLTLLSAPLARNSHLSCQGQQNAALNCNFLRTDALAAIYDDSDSRLYLFLAPDLLPEANAQQDRYWQPTADAQRALVHSQSLNLSAGDETQALALAGRGALGVTADSYAIADWRFDYQRHAGTPQDTHQLALNNLYYRQEIARRYYWQAGRMDSADLSRADGGNFSFSLLPVPAIDGARLGTTQAWLRQRDRAVATPVTVLLNRFSRVEAWRGDQLLSTAWLEAGVQQLDTHALPAGSYPLELRIYEQDQLTRRETQPFSKSHTAVGDQQWDLFIQGGRPIRQAATGERGETATTAQAGVRMPLSAAAALQQGVSAVGRRAYGETRLDWSRGLGNGALSVSAAWLYGADGARGDSETLAWSGPFSLSLYHYRQQAGDCLTNRDLQWGGCNESVSASLGLSLAGWHYTLGYTDNRNESRYRAGLVFDDTLQPHWHWTRGHSRNGQFNASRAWLWQTYSLTSNLGLWQSVPDNGPRDRGLFLTLSVTQTRPADAGRSRTLSAGYTLRQSRAGDAQQDGYLNAQWSYSTDGAQRELETRLSGSDASYEGVVRLRNSDRFGDLNGALSVSRARRDGATHHSATLAWDASLAVSPHGLFWGGNATGIDRLAGSVIAVEAEETQTPLVAFSGAGHSVQTLRGGQRALAPLAGLREATFSVTEVADGEVNVQLSHTGETPLFLLPGHVRTQIVQAETSRTWVGRALDAQGNPLGGAVILNTPALPLEADGGFSFDMPHAARTLWLLHQQRLFACPADAKPRSNALVWLGQIRCQPISKASLPASLSHDRRVSALLTAANATP